MLSLRFHVLYWRFFFQNGNRFSLFRFQFEGSHLNGLVCVIGENRMNEIQSDTIEKMIFIIRGQKVMLDSDLAELYGVDTRRLHEQVKRNVSRFPEDFMIKCGFSELDDLRSQFATANPPRTWNYKRRGLPVVFTESGVAMLSTVLNSERAIQVNIAIIRIFVKLRSYYSLENASSDRLGTLEKNTTKLFRIVFERLDRIDETIHPKLSPKRKKIGLK